MLDITRMLTEKKFRDDVIAHITDPVVKTFWTTEFASWNDKFAAEAVAPVLNKVGAFVANPMIRNIVGQTKSTFNIREIMDEGKILIVNLSRGLVGEDNAAILGSLMVTKIQLAAMSRANVALDQRKPFYLYVDEFQNFATDSFAVILSEARKYGLNLTVANQYVSQMNPVVRDAVFENVGSMISFRVGADDATFLSKYFAPQFEPNDMMTLHNRNFVATMTIKGEKSIPFSGMTLNYPPKQQSLVTLIITNSRQRYANSKDQVEKKIATNMGSSPAYQTSIGQQVPKTENFIENIGINPIKAVLKTTGRSIKQKSAPVSTTSTASTGENRVEPVQSPPQKKKRTRSRRKKQTNNEHSAVMSNKSENQQKNISENKNPEHEIKLR